MRSRDRVVGRGSAKSNTKSTSGINAPLFETARLVPALGIAGTGVVIPIVRYLTDSKAMYDRSSGGSATDLVVKHVSIETG